MIFKYFACVLLNVYIYYKSRICFLVTHLCKELSNEDESKIPAALKMLTTEWETWNTLHRCIK